MCCGGISDPFPAVLIIQSRNLGRGSTETLLYDMVMSSVEISEHKIVFWGLPAQARASQSPIHPAFCEIKVLLSLRQH